MMQANSQFSDLSVFKRILIYKPDVNMTDNAGRTALHLAARAGKRAEVKELLKLDDIEKDIKSVGGETALMSAVLHEEPLQTV